MGWQLAAYLALARTLPLVAKPILRRRLRRGKEHPVRWCEKLGQPTSPRPDGRLIWLHAVGLGEVLALRGLIATLAELDRTLSFLVTSTTLSSLRVMATNLPPRTTHQFLPLDSPRYLTPFLEHWRPDLSVWAEQDLWPGAVVAANRKGVPLALVNARMNAASYAKRARVRGLYADLYAHFALIAAQDEITAQNLISLGAKAPLVSGSLKAAAPPLAVDPVELAQMQTALKDRAPWLLASSHAEDEAMALMAHRERLAVDPTSLLVIVPRNPSRAEQITAQALGKGMSVTRKTQSPLPGPEAQVHIVDAFGDLGLWYRLCPVALIGGTFGPTEGHNPWEAACLGAAILHGPQVANFAADFALLDGAGAALCVAPETLATRLAQDLAPQAIKARQLASEARGSLRPLATDLLGLLR